jgi:4-coumarate--CoA ligase
MANASLTSTEYQHILEKSRPSIIFVLTTALSTLNNAISSSSLPSPIIYTVSDTYAYYHNSSPSSLPPSDWTNLLTSPELSHIPSFVKDESSKRASFILWSSGTSGKSKGVVISHRAVIAMLCSLRWSNPGIMGGEGFENKDGIKDGAGWERWISLPPWYHVFGLSNQILLGPILGATIMVIPKVFRFISRCGFLC